MPPDGSRTEKDIFELRAPGRSETRPAARESVQRRLSTVPSEDVMFLLDEYAGLLRWIARQHEGPQGDLKDLIQEAKFGLWDAIERFDPSKEKPFRHFVHSWARARVAYAKDLGGMAIPRSTMIQVETVEKDFLRVHGRQPTDQEVAELLPQAPSVECVHALRTCRRPVSLNAPFEEDDEEVPKTPFVEKGEDALETVDVQLDAVGFLRKLNQVPRPHARFVVLHTFGLEGAEVLTDNEMGKRLGCSDQTIGKLRARAVYFLKTDIWLPYLKIPDAALYRRRFDDRKSKKKLIALKHAKMAG